MGSCLVTKLKGSVNDPNLDYLGGVKLHIDANANPTILNRAIQVNGATRAFIINETGEGCYFTDENFTENRGKEATTENNGFVYTGGTQFVMVKGTGSCDIIVTSKYDLTDMAENTDGNTFENFFYCGANTESGCTINIWRNNNVEGGVDLGEVFDGAKVLQLGLWGHTPNLPIKALQYIRDLSYLKTAMFSSVALTAEDLNIIKSLTTLTNINLHLVGASVSSLVLTDFGAHTSLTRITIYAGTVQLNVGSIENFVAAQRSNGRTTCEELKCSLLETGVTFNGSKVDTQGEKILSWTASTITYDGVTINA